MSDAALASRRPDEMLVCEAEPFASEPGTMQAPSDSPFAPHPASLPDGNAIPAYLRTEPAGPSTGDGVGQADPAFLAPMSRTDLGDAMAPVALSTSGPLFLRTPDLGPSEQRGEPLPAAGEAAPGDGSTAPRDERTGKPPVLNAAPEADETGESQPGKEGTARAEKRKKPGEGDPGTASDGAGKDETQGAAAAQKGKDKRPSGAKGKGTTGRDAADEAVQNVVAVPLVDTASPTFSRSPVQPGERGEAFRPAEPPPFRVTPKAGGKPEPPSPQRAQAVVQFREAMAQTARLHAAFRDMALQAASSVQATEASLASQAQGDLDRGLSTLRSGLDQARLDLDLSADAADGFIELRRQQTYAAITANANSAIGTLNTLKKKAEGDFKGHEGDRKAKGKAADAARGGVTSAGDLAAEAVRGLDASKERDFPTWVRPMPSAINEAVGTRIPKRSKERAQTYTEERNAQDVLLTGIFTKMKEALDTQFKAIAKAMDETAANSIASITKARAAARKQLAKGAREMHRSVAQARARGHASLVDQHNTLRRQMIGSHRDRAMRENAQAQQRAARGTGAALSAAKAQQTAADSLGEALDKEAARPPDDLAKVMSASAGGVLRQARKAGPEQRDRLDRSVKAGEDDARMQSQSLGGKLGASALEAAEQLRTASRSAGDGLHEQVKQGTEPFGEIPGQIVAALGSTLPTTTKGYEALNQGTEEKPGAGLLIVAAQKTIDDALAGNGGGKGNDKGDTGTPKVADGKAKGPKEKPAEFRERAKGIAKKPRTDDGIKALVATAQGDIPPRVENKVGPLYNALKATSTPVESVMAELRGLTKQQGRALSDVYRTKKGRNLAAHLRSELRKTFSADYTNDQNIAAALAYLAGDNVKAAKHELNAAVYLWNDTGRSEKVLRALTPEQLDKLNEQHPGVMADVSGDLEESEKKIFDALKQIKPTENLQGKALEDQRAANYKLLGVANAHALKRDIDQALETKGEEGGDKAVDTVSTGYQAAGSDAISGGDGAYEDPAEAEARRKAVWEETNKSFEKEAAPKLPDGSPNVEAKEGHKLGAIARYAAAARTRTEFVPDDGPNGGHWENVTKGLDPRQARLLDDIAKTGPNSEDTAASTIEFETNRKEGRPREDKLRKALLGEDLMAAREGESDDDRAKRLADKKDASGKVVEQGDLAKTKERKANILKKVAERRAEGQRTADGKPVEPMKPEDVQKQITSQLDVRFVGDPTGAAYTKSMIESDTLEPDPEKAFDFALAHDERNKETLKATTERMNRDQIKEKVAKWDEGKPESDRLYARLGLYGHDGKLEGDARNDTELAFRGKPRNEKEKALNAIFVVEQQRRDSTATGRGLASGDYDAMTAEQATVLRHLGVTRDQIDETGDIKLGPDKKEIRGNFDPVTGKIHFLPGEAGEAQRAEFESAMRFSYMNAESYKQAVDRISQGIVMALVVAAAIITTFVTFGGAAAIWGPILITAAAGFAGMGMTALIRGDRYTSAEIQRDFVMTLVQAATAGLGAAIGAGAKGAGAVAKGASTVEKGAETAAKAAATGEKLAAGAAGVGSKQGLSFGAKAMQFGKEAVVGGGTNSINSFAAAAMDPENRRQGKALGKAVDGGVKGFLSGSLGAAVTKPMSALGRPLGKAGERMAGNVGSGFGTRLAEARIGQAMGDPHQSWAESIEGAKEGIAQDAIQGFGEHHAEGAAERRAARKSRTGAPPRADATLPGARPAAEGEHPEGPAKAVNQVPDDDGGARASAVREAIPPEVRPIAEAAAKAANDNEPGQPARRATSADEFPPSPPRRDDALELRTRGNDDDLPPSQRKTGEFPAVERTLQDHLADTEAYQPPPLFVTADITPDMLKGKPSIPRYSEITATNPKSVEAGRANYEALRAADPLREVMLARCVDPNHADYGKYKVFQGGEKSVSRPPEGWITERHSHPWLISGDQAAMLTRSLPSGKGADFEVLRGEVDMLAGLENKTVNVARTSVIDVRVGDNHHQTTFSVTRNGDKYEYRLSVNPPINGVGERGPFRNLDGYEKWAQKETRQQFAKGGETYGALEGLGGATARRAVHGEPITPPMRQDLDFIAGRMALAGDPDSPAVGSRPHPDLDPAVARAAAMSDARQRIIAMGLVGQPDSMVRLHNILNDDAIPARVRAMVSDLTLTETRNHLLDAGELAPGEPLVMLFHGATPERTQSLVTKGIDMRRKPGGPHDDFGQGLYFTRSFETALKYRDTRSSTAAGGAQGGVVPYLLRGRDMANSVDVSSSGGMRAKWEAFAVAKAHTLLHGGDLMMTPAVQKILRGEVRSFADFDPSLHQNRGKLFNDFLASVGATPDVIFGDLGGPLTHGIQLRGVTDQVVIRGQGVADILNRQHVRADTEAGAPGAVRGAGELEMRTASRIEGSGETSAPRRREMDPAIDRAVEGAIGEWHPEAGRDGVAPPGGRPPAAADGAATPAPRPRITAEGWQLVTATITGFLARNDRFGASLNTLMALAPHETGRVLRRIAFDSFDGRTFRLTDEQVAAVAAEAVRRGATPAQARALAMDLLTVATPQSPLHQNLSEAPFGAGFDRGMQQRLDAAFVERQANRVARDYADRNSPTQARRDMRRLLDVDPEGVMRAILSPGTPAQRALAFFRARRAAGAGLIEAFTDMRALRRALSDPGYAVIERTLQRRRTATGTTAADLVALVRRRPDELLHLARTSPDQLAEYYADFILKQIHGEQFDGLPTADRFARYVAARQRSNVLPVGSETSSIWANIKRLGLHLLKADAVSRGGANRPGLDIVGFRVPPGSRVGRGDPVEVVIMDDKAYYSRTELESVSAMTGDRLPINLRAAANEIEADVARLRNLGEDIVDERIANHIAGAEAAVAQMRRAAAELDAIRPARTSRMRDPAYLSQVADVLARNRIVPVISRQYGNIRVLAQWLIVQGFVFDDDDARRLAEAIERRRGRR